MISRLPRAACALMVIGCSGPSEPPNPLHGDFVARDPWVTFPGFVLGLSLAVNGTTVTGTGWLGGVGYPLELLTVSGAFTNPDFDLTVTTGDGVQGSLAGTVTASGIQASYAWAPWATPAAVTLMPVNGGATGRFTATITGDVSHQQSGAAAFGVLPSGLVLILQEPGATNPMAELGRPGPRPGPGTYVLDPTSAFGGNVYVPGTPFPQLFTITGGTLRIGVSTPYALIGRLEVQAQESETGATLNLTADFSAGCGVENCI